MIIFQVLTEAMLILVLIIIAAPEEFLSQFSVWGLTFKVEIGKITQLDALLKYMYSIAFLFFFFITLNFSMVLSRQRASAT